MPPSAHTLRPDIVLFDWDGTLVDTLPLIRAAHDSVWALHADGPLTDDVFEAILLADPRAVFADFYGRAPEQARADFYDFIERKHIETLTPFPHAAETLHTLKAHGVALGLVSKKTRKYLVAEAEALTFTALFSCIIATGDSAREKPHPDPILKALTHFPPTAPERIWYVGDAESDMAAATAAGVQPVLLLHDNNGHGGDKGKGNAHEYKRTKISAHKRALIDHYKPTHVFENLAALQAYFTAL